MGHTSTKKIFIVYLKSSFKQVSLYILSGNPIPSSTRTQRSHGDSQLMQVPGCGLAVTREQNSLCLLPTGDQVEGAQTRGGRVNAAASWVFPRQLLGTQEEKRTRTRGCAGRRFLEDTSSSPEPQPFLHGPPWAVEESMDSGAANGWALSWPHGRCTALLPTCTSIPFFAQWGASCYFPGSFGE